MSTSTLLLGRSAAEEWIESGGTLPPHNILALATLCVDLIVLVLLEWPRQVAGKEGILLWTCQCDIPMIVRSASPVLMACANRTCHRSGEAVAPVLFPIAYTPLSDFLKLSRRHMGGTRGPPLLRDIPFLPLPPVLHCTGKSSKSLILFMFAFLPQAEQTEARLSVYNVMGRSNMGGMYLREFCLLVAHIVAVPYILGVPVESAAAVMLQLSQLLTASWRRAIGTSSAAHRECAGATLQLAEAIPSMLCSTLKPHDPETKTASVLNLYLHAALAHVRGTVGSAFPDASLICDDRIEGQLAGLKKFCNARTINASLGERLVNKEGIDAVRTQQNVTKAEGRTSVEQMIFTREISVRTCVNQLGFSVPDNVGATVDFTDKDPNLAVQVRRGRSSA